MRGKLQKKTKKEQIIFPSYYLGHVDSERDRSKINQKVVQVEGGKKNRVLSRSNSRDKIRSACKRSLSVKEQSTKATWDREKPKKNVDIFQKGPKNMNKDGGLVKKKGKKFSSFGNISSAYYQGLQKLLQKQCQTIINSNYLQNEKKIHIQSLSNNIFFIKQLKKKDGQQGQLQKKHGQLKKSSNSKQSKKKGQQSQKIISPQSSFENNKEQIEIRISPFLQTLEKLDIGIIRSSEPIDSFQEKYFQQQQLEKIHSEKLVRRSSREKDNYDKSFLKKVWFLTSKFNLKQVQILKIISLEMKTLFNNSEELSIFLQKRSVILYTKLVYRAQKMVESRYKRRTHIRKLTNKKNKQKEFIFNNFAKTQGHQLNYQVYFNIINYCEQHLIIQQTHKGLILSENIQNYAISSQNGRYLDRHHEDLYYFLSKINSTFYLIQIKYDLSAVQPYVRFTYLYDFTTFSFGTNNYEIFMLHQHIKNISKKSHRNKIIQKLIKQYIVKKEEEIYEKQFNYMFREEGLSGRIGQICANLVQKWNDEQSIKMKNINKEYKMMGDLTNYFRYHSQFDYGFFNSTNKYFVNKLTYYILGQTQKYLRLYSYAHNYIYLELNQKQKEALVIPHTLSIKSTKQSEELISSFIKKAILRKYKAQHQYYQLFIKHFLIKLKQKDNNLQIIIQNIQNFRSNKIISSIKDFPTITEQGQEQVNYKKASLSMNKYLRSFKLHKSFLYSKYCKQQIARQIIHYKSIHKIQGNYIFVTLYSIPLHNLIEFKIYIFKLGRQFVIKLDNIQNIDQRQAKELINNILELVKNSYLKKFIIQEAKKNQKRKIDVLEKFFKQQGNSIASNLKNKKKFDDNIKKKIMRVAVLKDTNQSSVVYENIISHYFKNKQNIFYLITIRYLPWQQLKQQNDCLNNKIQICVHKENTLTYFKYIIEIQQLIQNITYGSLTIKEMDTRYIYNIFLELKIKMMDIINNSDNKINSVIIKLRKYLKGEYKDQHEKNEHEKYVLVEHSLIPIIEEEQVSISSYVSIYIEESMEKKIQNSQKKTNYDFSKHYKVNKKLFVNLELEGTKIVKYPHFRALYKEFLIEIINVCEEKLEDAKGNQKETRELLIHNIVEGSIMFVQKWEIGFLNVIHLSKYNKKLINRLFRVIKRALQ